MTSEQELEVARSESDRIPVIAHQFVLRMDAQLGSNLPAPLADMDWWSGRLAALAMKGHNEDDLTHWIWILSAAEADTKVERLVSSDRYKPIFVLMAILRKDEYFLKPASLVTLYQYISNAYLKSASVGQRQEHRGATTRPARKMPVMGPDKFIFLLERLVHHSLTTLPSSIVVVAQLVVEYIRHISDFKPNKATQRTGYGYRCLVFNYALSLFRGDANVGNMHLIWKAQKILLEYSSGLERSLIIDRTSFRAVRTTLLGLKKSEPEQMTAVRYAKTWPPYIKQLDGIDETRDEHEFLSRSVKAGILKRSEGYADEPADRVLETLGGGGPGEFVTIQSRSAVPQGLDFSRLNLFTEWAARVKATRNANEAWQSFLDPPHSGLKPNYQVYAEMFSKLLSVEADPTSSILPGAARETFPYDEPNLTEYEQERKRPPSVPELYQRMLRDGNRPVHHCLSLLIRKAPSLSWAAQYLNDSPLDRDAVRDLTESFSPNYENLVRIPIPIFASYLALLCSQQPRRRWTAAHGSRPHREHVLRYDRLNKAIRLLFARAGPKRKPATTLWFIVMRALAHDKLVLRPYVSQAEDDVDALKMMRGLFDAYNTCQVLDPTPFDCLGRCVIRVCRHNLAGALGGTAENEAEKALATLKLTFAALITPARALGDTWIQPAVGVQAQLYHDISAANVQTYMKVLAEFDETDEAVRVVEWILKSWDTIGVLVNAKDPAHKQWGMLMQAILCFRAFAEQKISAETKTRLEEAFAKLQERGGTWAWPSDEDVKQYRTEQEEEDQVEYTVIRD